MRIFITGVAGFIGSNLAIDLLKKGHEIIGLDNFSTGFRHNIKDIENSISTSHQRFNFIEGDIRDYNLCLKMMENVDIVFHQAALGSVPRSLDTPHISTDVNVTGFVNILTAAQKCKVSKFLYASSSSVYGDSEKLPKEETDKGNLLSPYALTKAINESYGDVFARCYDMSIIGLRYFNVFGPRQNPKGVYAAVIPLWIDNLLHNKSVYINGDGNTSRDFTYITNVINANIAALNYNNREHAVFNIAAGGRVTLNELFNEIRKVLNKEDIDAIYRDFRPGDITHSYADISKARDAFGYNPSINAHQGIAKTVLWYLTSN
jgi:UDP-N-acetylglucosamine 4-epimerase